MDVINLIRKHSEPLFLQKVNSFIAEHAYAKHNEELNLKAGDLIKFKGGANNDVYFMTRITGFHEDINFAYVLWDCYWLAIHLEKRDFQKVRLDFSKEDMSYFEKLQKQYIKHSHYWSDTLPSLIKRLGNGEPVTIGWRESCGHTDASLWQYRIWKKAIAELKNRGYNVTEQSVPHGNGWATLSGGFWHEKVYTLNQ